MIERDQIPFNGLEYNFEKGAFFKLNHLESNQKLVVKELRDDSWLTDPDEIASETQNFINSVRGTSLETYLPKNQVVLGLNKDGEKTVYIASEKIEGQKLSRDILTDSDLQRLSLILKASVDFYISSFDGVKGTFLEFRGLSNYMRGANLAKDNDDKNNVYLVDLYPVDPLLAKIKSLNVK